MTPLSQKILSDFQVRKTKKQKQAFRDWLCGELKKLGYEPTIEKGSFSRNIVVGDPETAKVLFTAHYDTPPVLPVPNFITPRNMLWYLLYQLLLVLPMFVLAAGAEIGMMFFWEFVLGAECPMWVAIGTMYAALIFFLWWMLAGPANKHTANDNTSGTVTLAEIAQALPEELRDKVCLIFFDNEEKGLLGSSSFSGKHKDVKKNALVVNFDCVSDGDYIQFYPSKALKKDEATLAAFDAAYPSTASKTTEVVRSFGFYPSDQAQFRRGVGVCALKKKSIIGYYMDRIHTKRDTVMMEENIHLLRDGSVRLAEVLSAE